MHAGVSRAYEKGESAQRKPVRRDPSAASTVT